MKNNSEIAKRTMLNAISKMAFNTAKTSANSACLFVAHQPVVPKALKKLRKF